MGAKTSIPDSPLPLRPCDEQAKSAIITQFAADEALRIRVHPVQNPPVSRLFADSWLQAFDFKRDWAAVYDERGTLFSVRTYWPQHRSLTEYRFLSRDWYTVVSMTHPNFYSNYTQLVFCTPSTRSSRIFLCATAQASGNQRLRYLWICDQHETKDAGTVSMIPLQPRIKTLDSMACTRDAQHLILCDTVSNLTHLVSIANGQSLFVIQSRTLNLAPSLSCDGWVANEHGLFRFPLSQADQATWRTLQKEMAETNMSVVGNALSRMRKMVYCAQWPLTGSLQQLSAMTSVQLVSSNPSLVLVSYDLPNPRMYLVHVASSQVQSMSGWSRELRREINGRLLTSDKNWDAANLAEFHVWSNLDPVLHTEYVQRTIDPLAAATGLLRELICVVQSYLCEVPGLWFMARTSKHASRPRLEILVDQVPPLVTSTFFDMSTEMHNSPMTTPAPGRHTADLLRSHIAWALVKLAPLPRHLAQRDAWRHLRAVFSSLNDAAEDLVGKSLAAVTPLEFDPTVEACINLLTTWYSESVTNESLFEVSTSFVYETIRLRRICRDILSVLHRLLDLDLLSPPS